MPGLRQNELARGATGAVAPVDVGLYIHVAFCRTKCFYCDFNAYAGLGHLIDDYVRALVAEIERLPQTLPGFPTPANRPFRIGSIFFGGGTPSLLTPAQIAAVLEAAHRWPVATDAEISLEANPGDLSLAYLKELRATGVNRLSMGVQSFDDAMLRRLGRRHDAATAVAAFVQARQAGFANLSFDLMFGLPGQTLAHWQSTLDRALALAPDHISLYNLTIEPDTPFATWVAAGKLSVPDDDAAADLYQAAIDALDCAGFAHYEISNWARRGEGRDLRAQHNLRYWRNQPYLGVGAGAHSSFAGYRYADLLTPATYVARALAGESTVDNVEQISEDLAMGETLMLGLRLAEGVSLDDFAARFGRSIDAVYGATLSELAAVGLLARESGRLVLTPRGRFLGNEVFGRFLPEASA